LFAARPAGWTPAIFGSSLAPPEYRAACGLVSAGMCTLLSAAGFFLSLNLGEVSLVAWVAPVPVLWLAFGPMRARAAFFLAWAAYALGAVNLLEAYAGRLPLPILMLSLGGPALLFAASVVGERQVARGIGPLAGVFAFAMLWAGSDYLLSLVPDGSITSPAYSQASTPCLIRGVSIFGIWIVTFLLGFVSAELAMSLRGHRPLPAVLAIFLSLANAGFGVWRIDEAAGASVTHIGLGVDDSLGRASVTDRPSVALDAIDAYVIAAWRLATLGPTVIVFPKKLAVLSQEWRDQAPSN